MPTFEIETYKVTSQLNRFPGETRPNRVLEMTGPVLYHGIQNRAMFGFSPVFDGVWSNPVSGYLVDGGFAGLYVVGWFPLAEYTYYYEILRNERPIHVIFEFKETGATDGYLRLVGLGTSGQKIGEGPSDSAASMSSMLLAQFERVHERVLPMPTLQDLPREAREGTGQGRGYGAPPS